MQTSRIIPAPYKKREGALMAERKKRKAADYYNTTIGNALRLLERLATRRDWGVTELSRALKLHKNYAFRILDTLRHYGFVTGNTEGRYALTAKLAQLAQGLLLPSIAEPIIAELGKKTGETALLSVLREDRQVVFLLAKESPHWVSARPPLHETFPALETAEGRVQLAYMDGTAADGLDDAAAIRQDGYVEERGMSNPHATCIAAPIFNHEGQITGTVSVQAPSFRANPHNITPAVTAAASDISQKLGYEQ